MSPFQLFEKQATRKSQKVFLIEENESKIVHQFTYEEFYQLVIKAAATLSNLDVHYQDRVAIILPRPFFPKAIAVWLAANALGAIAVFLEDSDESTKKQKQLTLIEPKLVVTESNVTVLQTSGASVVNWHEPSPKDIAGLIFNSGANNYLEAVMQTNEMYWLAGGAFPYWLGLSEQDYLYSSLSPAHLNFQAYSLMGTIMLGATLIIGEKIWSPRATVVNTLGGMMEGLSNFPEEKGSPSPIIFHDEPIADSNLQWQVEKRLDTEIITGYGINENLFGFVTPRRSYRKEKNLVGLKKLHPQLSEKLFLRTLIYEDRVMVTKPGEIGELALLNPATTPGYWNNPELTTSKIWGYGWWLTGDLFTFDESGYLHWIGRREKNDH